MPNAQRRQKAQAKVAKRSSTRAGDIPVVDRITQKQRAAQEKADALTKQATPATPARIKTKRASAEQPAPALAIGATVDVRVLNAASVGRSAPAPVAGIVPTFEDAVARCGGRRIVLANINREKAKKEGWTWDAVDVNRLRIVAQTCGAHVAAALWRVTEDMVRERLGGKPGSVRPPVRATPAVRSKATPSPEHAPQPRAALALVDDAALAVPLATLAPGTAFKTPDSPEEGLPGLRGVVVRHCGTLGTDVAMGGKRHVSITKVDGESVEFDAPGKHVRWPASVMVVVVAAEMPST